MLCHYKKELNKTQGVIWFYFYWMIPLHDNLRQKISIISWKFQVLRNSLFLRAAPSIVPTHIATGRGLGSRVRQNRIPLLALPSLSCELLGKALNLCGPRFSILQYGDNDISHSIELLWEMMGRHDAYDVAVTVSGPRTCSVELSYGCYCHHYWNVWPSLPEGSWLTVTTLPVTCTSEHDPNPSHSVTPWGEKSPE